MNNNTPSDEFVMAITVPQGVRSGYLISSVLDDFLFLEDDTKSVNTFHGVNDSSSLNAKALCLQKPSYIAKAAIWPMQMIGLDKVVQFLIGDLQKSVGYTAELYISGKSVSMDANGFR
jgi:hypothetical protein